MDIHATSISREWPQIAAEHTRTQIRDLQSITANYYKPTDYTDSSIHMSYSVLQKSPFHIPERPIPSCNTVHFMTQQRRFHNTKEPFLLHDNVRNTTKGTFQPVPCHPNPAHNTSHIPSAIPFCDFFCKKYFTLNSVYLCIYSVFFMFSNTATHPLVS